MFRYLLIMLFVFYVPEMGNIILRDFFKKTLTNRLVGIIIITVTVPIIFLLVLFLSGIWQGRIYMYGCT